MNISEHILGNDRLPERRLLLYVYLEEYALLRLRFMSNKTWENNLDKYVELQFTGVSDYISHFPRPKIEPWLNIDENNYQYSDKLPLIHLSRIAIDSNKKCIVTFHDSFGRREFAFDEFEYTESKASRDS